MNNAIEQIQSIAQNPVFVGNTCAACQATLEVAKFLFMAAPETGPPFMIALCQHFKLSGDCYTMFGKLDIGSVATQVIANADVGGLDGQVGRLDVVSRNTYSR